MSFYRHLDEQGRCHDVGYVLRAQDGLGDVRLAPALHGASWAAHLRQTWHHGTSSKRARHCWLLR